MLKEAEYYKSNQEILRKLEQFAEEALGGPRVSFSAQHEVNPRLKLLYSQLSR